MHQVREPDVDANNGASSPMGDAGSPVFTTAKVIDAQAVTTEGPPAKARRYTYRAYHTCHG